MSDQPNAAPAGAGEQQPVNPTPIGPMSVDDASSAFAELGIDSEPAAEVALENNDQPIENTSEEAPEAAAEAATEDTGEETEADEAAEAPEADQAEEQSESEPEEEQLAHGNMKTRLRDGTVTTVGELKKLADEARELRGSVPKAIEEIQHRQAAAEQTLKERETQLAQREELAHHLLKSHLPSPPDPKLIDRNSPDYDVVRYLEEEALYNAEYRKLQGVAQNIQEQRLQQQKQEEAAREAELQAYRESQHKALVEKIPDIVNPQKAEQIFSGFLEVASKYGFSETELRNVDDHRLLHMIYEESRDAAAYRKLMAQKQAVQAKVKQAAPVQKPGARVSPEVQQRRSWDDQLKRARDSGGISTSDAAANLATLFEERA